MFTGNREITERDQPMTLDARFAGEEVRRLEDLRRHYADLQCGEQGLDIRRLAFARWLVRTGRLSEDLGLGASADKASAA